MTYLQELKNVSCRTFFSGTNYFLFWYTIKNTIMIYEIENMKNLIEFCNQHKSMTNQFILSYIYKNLMLLQLILKGHEFYNVHSFAGYKLIMEDEYVIHTDFENKLQLCAVFDGHSGSQCVTYLKENYVQRLYNNTHFKDFLNTNSQDDMILAFKTITIEIDEYMINTKIKGGSTAIVSIVTPDNIYLSNLGDSRAIVICDPSDKNFFATTDQKPNMYEERIKKAGGFVRKDRVDGSLAIGNCFGDIHFKNNISLPISEQKVVADCDVTVIKNNFNILGIVLGCDGIFDVYENIEIIDDICTIAKMYTGNLAELIVNMCLLKESHDNLTICTSIKRKIPYEINNTKIFTSETFNYLKLISDFITKTQKLTKAQLNKQQTASLIKTIISPVPVSNIEPMQTINKTKSTPICTTQTINETKSMPTCTTQNEKCVKPKKKKNKKRH